MARRKRIPYDPPGQRKRRRRSIPRADQIFMSRRMFVAKGAIVTAFGALAARLGYMQVSQRDVYRQQARGNIQQYQTIKAPRGMVLDRSGRDLAVNRRSWEVRVIPGELPEEPAARRRVLDTLVEASGLPDALVLDPALVPQGSEETVFARTIALLDDVGLMGNDDAAGWMEYITREVGRNYLVVLAGELSTDQAARCRAAEAGLPGVRVMNVLDYRIGNASDPRQKVIVRSDIPREVALKLEANKLYLPGVELDNSVLARRYPGGEVMSHLLGYVQPISKEERAAPENLTTAGHPIYEYDDLIGKDGIEKSMERLLRGSKGSRWVEVDAHQIEQRVVPGTEIPAVPGRNLKLTVDLELQAAISRVLKEAIRFANEDRRAKGKVLKHEAGAGAVVAIDPRSGEVLAMVSYPHFDNQLFVDGISQRQYDEYISEKANKPLYDRALRGQYPPGSTLKPFLAAAALQERKINTETSFTCTGAIRVPHDWDESKGTDHPCWKEEGHGGLDVYGAIEQSCDVFFYNVGAPRQKLDGATEYLRYYDLNLATNTVGEKHYFNGLGIGRVKENLQKGFWFGAPTGIDLPAEAAGVVPDPRWLAETNPDANWSVSATINVSIGQGYFLTTPLQLALNTAALANGGTIYKPLLVREIVDDRGRAVQGFEPQALRQLGLAKEHLEAVREGMRRVVHDPNGSAYRSPDGSSKWALTNPEGEPEIAIAGKTGTAEIGTADEEGNYDRQHAWFTAFAPLDKPEIAIAVVVEDGGEGSSYAVPVADKVLRAYFELAGKRARGKVLRKDGQIPSDDAPAPVEQMAAPAPGSTAAEPRD